MLLVEDDERIRQALGLALNDEGFDVVEAASGEEALHRLDIEAFDVVLLDLMLPGVNGLAVCQALRSRVDLRIIIVTARTDTSDVIAGLEAGADDYVTKPLVASELAARIRALLRRRRGDRENAVYHMGEIEIRPDEGVVRRAGADVRLTKTEFRLLAEPAGRRGPDRHQEQLLRRVWGYDYYGDTRLLDVHIRRLRCKIEHDPDAPRVVVTVRETGYRVDQNP